MKFIKDVLITLLYSVLVTIVVFFIATCAQAREFKLVELNELIIDYKNYALLNPSARNALIYPENPKESLNVIINIDLMKYVFWNNTIESYTTPSQYRSIGLQSRLGVRVIPQIDIMYFHHSQHLLDRPHAFMHQFPVEDAVEIRLNLYRRNKEDTLVGDVWELIFGK